MKQSLIRLLSVMIILAGCAPATVAVTARPSPTRTSPPIPIPATVTPSSTQIPSTPTITSLPTIPTFTPTFAVSTVVTVTPAAPAICPKENPAVIARFVTPGIHGYEFFGVDDVLTYLNSGGALSPFVTGPAGTVSDTILGTIVDLTGDGVNEVVVRGLVRYDIVGCKDGKYQDLFKLATYDFSMDLEEVIDLNKDGIPELIFYGFSRYGYASIYIVGWDGNGFHSLIDAGVDPTTGNVLDSVFATTYHKSMDTNGDGLKEVIVVYDVQTICGGLGDPCDGTPTRKQTTTLGWNGKNYVDLLQGNYAPPEYRFQAIQDADEQVRYGNYAGALSLYQEAIFNDELEWWSLDRRNYQSHVYMSGLESEPVVSPTPVLDHNEYPRLAAYAYYRIMLLHIVQGHESDAGTVYKTLQQKFGNHPYGQPYVEMADTFWNTYQSTHKMYDSCAAVIQYAVDHPEILTPLGSYWNYGLESRDYVPEDVCPFR